MTRTALPCSPWGRPVSSRHSRFLARPARFCSHLFACTLLAVSLAAHADFSGQVISVLDGDTVDVLVDKSPVRVRLAQIDAPEKSQAFGSKSRQALAAMVARQVVTVRATSNDRYGRVVGTVWLGADDINKAMVRQGMAWAYRAYLQDRTMLAIEAHARSEKLGLWFDAQPVPPWEWRAAKRKGGP